MLPPAPPRRFVRLPLPGLLLVPLLLLATLARAAELTVLAAASLADALREAAPGFTAATGHTLRFNFGGSGTLARQIREGAPADLFVSADELRMDALEHAGLLLPGTRRPVLANILVLAVSADSPLGPATPTDLLAPAFRRIAVGEPATVPAGTYARQHLEKLDLWTPLSPKLLPVDSVRAALATLESGNADAAFVYRTDALSSKKVRIALEFPPPEGPSITYPVAALRDTRHPAATRALLAWLTTDHTAHETFARHGFLPAP